MQTAQYNAVVSIVTRNANNAEIPGVRQCFQDLLELMTNPAPTTDEERTARLLELTRIVLQTAQVYAARSMFNPAYRAIANTMGATSWGLNLALAVAEATITLEEVTPPEVEFGKEIVPGKPYPEGMSPSLDALLKRLEKRGVIKDDSETGGPANGSFDDQRLHDQGFVMPKQEWFDRWNAEYLEGTEDADDKEGQ